MKTSRKCNHPHDEEYLRVVKRYFNALYKLYVSCDGGKTYLNQQDYDYFGDAIKKFNDLTNSGFKCRLYYCAEEPILMNVDGATYELHWKSDDKWMVYNHYHDFGDAHQAFIKLTANGIKCRLYRNEQRLILE